MDYLVYHLLAEGMSGGTGSASTAGMDVSTAKDSYIPLFSGQPSDYKEWRKRLTIYVLKMRMQKREAEGLLNVIGSLSGTAWKLLENFPIEEIEKTGALDKILKTLDKALSMTRRSSFRMTSIATSAAFNVDKDNPSWTTPRSMTTSTTSWLSMT